MDIRIHHTFLPQDDPDAALAFYRDTLGFEVLNDVGYSGMRWITVRPGSRTPPSCSTLRRLIRASPRTNGASSPR